jgi:hypothetical protein
MESLQALERQIADVLHPAVARVASLSEPACAEDIALIESESKGATDAVSAFRGGSDREQRLRDLHRLNNRLTGIISMSTLAREEARDAHLRDALTSVEAAARGAAHMVRQVATEEKARS